MYKFRLLKFLLLPLVFLMFLGCGNGVQIETAQPNPLPTDDSPPSNSTNPSNSNTPSPPPPPKLADVTTSAFIVGSSFPADIDIVNQPGVQNIMFITTSFPGSVLAVDLTTNPLSISGTVAGLTSLPGGSGIPSNLFVVDAAHAFLLTSSSVLYFNPTNGSIYQTLSLTDPIALTAPLAQVDANGNPLANVSGSFTPSFPAHLAMVGNKLAVSFSNLFFVGFSLDHAVQGVVRLYDVNASAPFLTPSAMPYLATSRMNATGLTPLPNGTLLTTNTGITKFTPDFSNQEPVTPGSVDLIDPAAGSLTATLDLGMTAPAFRSWAVTPDGDEAFIGSASGGYVLEIGLNPLAVLRGGSNPIVITNAANGTDFIDEVVMFRQGTGFFPMSFNLSTVYGVDLTGAQPTLLGNSVDLSFPGSPGVTGAGPAVLRPGTPGVDFTGPDLFVLTGSPGTVAAIKTY